jgi:peptidoglycan L-alanyl-D-glutamate endopeptidase CwlK
MPVFSQKSLKNLAECHETLQKLAKSAILHFDFAVICGHRDEESQELAFQQGKSKKHWPESKHNKTPSLAFDAVPLVDNKVSWAADDFDDFARVMFQCAVLLDIDDKIIWGGEFKTLVDRPHWEVKE